MGKNRLPKQFERLPSIPEYFRSLRGKMLWTALLEKRPIVFFFISRKGLVQEVIAREFTGAGFEPYREKPKDPDEPMVEPEVQDRIVPVEEAPPATPEILEEQAPATEEGTATLEIGNKVEFKYEGKELKGRCIEIPNDDEVIIDSDGTKYVVKSDELLSILV